MWCGWGTEARAAGEEEAGRLKLRVGPRTSRAPGFPHLESTFTVCGASSHSASLTAAPRALEVTDTGTPQLLTGVSSE